MPAGDPTTHERVTLADPVVVARAQAGHRPSLDRLLRALQEPLHRHVRSLVRDADLADDVLQEVLWLVARRLPQLRDLQWFRAWAYRIATREAVRRARAERRWRDALRGDALLALEAATEEPPFDPDLVRTVIDRLDTLSPASAVVLRLHYVEGMTYQEIAEALEVAVGTVKSRVAYGMAALRRAGGVPSHGVTDGRDLPRRDPHRRDPRG